MASNLELTELEQRVLDYVKRCPGSDLDRIIRDNFGRWQSDDIAQALSNLISQSYVSADEDLRFHAVG